MTITKTVNGNEAVLSVEGWLDTAASPEMHKEIEGLDEGIESLVIDLEKLEYISSSGVREVVAAYKKMKGALTVKNASSSIMSIFKATGIDKKIKFQ